MIHFHLIIKKLKFQLKFREKVLRISFNLQSIFVPNLVALDSTVCFVNGEQTSFIHISVRAILHVSNIRNTVLLL